VSVIKRDEVLKTLRGETVSVIPTIAEWFMDVTVPRSFGLDIPAHPVAGALFCAEFFGNFDVCVQTGPAEKTLSETPAERVLQYETGAVWRERYQPVFCREPLRFPVNSPEDVFKFKMPPPAWDTDIPGRVRFFKEKGYFVQGVVPGVWGHVYYYLTSMENILLWMAAEEEAAFKIFDIMGAYIVELCGRLLDAGVDAIFTANDLGTGSSLLFSGDLFKRFIFPWLKKISDICHQRGAFLHLHSHGHIQDIMDTLVDAGVDILNPVGPSDRNDLAFFKRKWGGKITLLGGVSTTVADMSGEEIEAHIARVMEAGCGRGRFMPRTESGIPLMPVGKARFFIDTLARHRKEFAGKT
jgi:hypothetical protein